MTRLLTHGARLAAVFLSMRGSVSGSGVQQARQFYGRFCQFSEHCDPVVTDKKDFLRASRPAALAEVLSRPPPHHHHNHSHHAHDRRIETSTAMVLIVGFWLVAAIALKGMLSMGFSIPEEKIEDAEITPDHFMHAVLWFLDSVDYTRGWLTVADTPSARKSFYVYLRLINLARVLTIVLIFSSFFTKPLWCDKVNTGVKHPCASELYPTWPITYWAPVLYLTLEVMIMTLLSMHIGLAKVARGDTFWAFPRGIALLTVAILYWFQIGYRAANSPFGVTPLHVWLRAAFLFLYTPWTHDTMRTVVYTIPKVFPLMVLGVIMLAIFGWTAANWFHHTLSKEEDHEFNDFTTACWSLFILATTANFPDVMMPIYSHHRFYFFFFLVWVTVSVFMLTPMCGALVYSTYMSQTRENERKLQQRKVDGRENAFNTLKLDGVITRPLLEVFLESARGFYPVDRAEELDAKIDESFADGDMSKEDFDSLLDFLEEAQEVAPRPMIEKLMPSLLENTSWLKLRDIYEGDVPWLVMDFAVLAVNLKEGLTTQMNGSDMTDDTILLCLFILDAIIKWIVQGFRASWQVYWNIFDFLVTLMCMGICYAKISTTDAAVDKELNLAFETLTVLRMCRYLRLFALLPNTEKLMLGFENAIPKVASLFTILVVFMYLFASCGLALFGGLITTDKESPHYAALSESDFAKANYHANSFNDLASSMVVLFEVLVVNNWFVITDGYTTTAGRFAWIYFVAFWFVGVVVFLNILIALFVDVVAQLAAADDEEDGGNEEAAKEPGGVAVAAQPAQDDDENKDGGTGGSGASGDDKQDGGTATQPAQGDDDKQVSEN